MAAGSLGTCLSCADLTAPPPHTEAVAERTPEPATARAAPPSKRPPRPSPAPDDQAAPDNDERIEASHVLITFTGARGATDTVTRSKEEAEKLVQRIARLAKQGEDFAKLAEQYSDDPSAKGRGGSLGKFSKRRMVKPFSDAAFALEPGKTSEPVLTPFGYHVIKRTE